MQEIRKPPALTGQEMHSNGRIVSYRIVSARQSKKKSIVLSRCEGEDKKKKVNGRVDRSRCGDVDGRESAMRCDAMRNAR